MLAMLAFYVAAFAGFANSATLMHPHHLHLTGNYEDLQQLKDLELRVLNDLGKSGGTGDDDSAKKLQALVDGIKDDIIVQHNSSMQILSDIMGAFATCNAEKADNDIELGTGKITITGSSSSHMTCRTQEKAAFLLKSECDRLLAALESTKAAACEALDNLNQGPLDDVCKGVGRETYESWVMRNKQWFVDAAAEFTVVKERCTNATREVDDQTPKCIPLTDTLVAQKGRCDILQRELETGTCSYGSLVESTCKGYGDCWNLAKGEYDHTTPQILSQAASRQSQWRAMKRIVCLINTMGKSDQDKEIDKCIEKRHDTSHLEIEIPPIPPKLRCTPMPNLPCGGQYFDQQYGVLPHEAPAETCAPCMINGVNSNGWVVVLKVDQDSTLGYSSQYWENDDLLNPGSSIDTPGNAKYSSYLDTPFERIRMCVGAPDSNCVEHRFSREWASAKELFSAGYIRDESLDRTGILGAFAPATGSYQDCPMQRPGFNIQCKDGNWARMGFCLNCAGQSCQNKDNNDADASIGIGLKGQETPSEMGGGWTNYFASGAGTCTPNSMTYKNVWLSVKAIVDDAVVPQHSGWNLIMKIAADSQLGFTSKYWENDELLNEGSPESVRDVNSKYESFLKKPFTSIRLCIGDPEGKCLEHTFDKQWASAKELFSAGYIRDESLDQTKLLDVFEPQKGSYQDCPMQRPGFNIQCKDGNWARMGFCLNCAAQPCQNDDKNDADASIGIGLKGQETGSEMGAGWTQYFASGKGTCNANSMTYKTAWLWVK